MIYFDSNFKWNGSQLDTVSASFHISTGFNWNRANIRKCIQHKNYASISKHSLWKISDWFSINNLWAKWSMSDWLVTLIQIIDSYIVENLIIKRADNEWTLIVFTRKQFDRYLWYICIYIVCTLLALDQEILTMALISTFSSTKGISIHIDIIFFVLLKTNNSRRTCYKFKKFRPS